MPGNMLMCSLFLLDIVVPPGSYRVLIEFIHVIPEILYLYYDTVVTVLVAR